MVKESVTLKETVEFLNSLIKVDSSAINALFSSRISCNEEMANHETVQVMARDGFFQVGMIGVLNGLFGIDKSGWGHIIADYEDGKITKFNMLKSTTKDRCSYCGTIYSLKVEIDPRELFIFCEHCDRTSFGGQRSKEGN